MRPYVDHADDERRRTARERRRARRHRRREDGRLRREPPKPRNSGCVDPDDPQLSQIGPHRRDGLPHPERHPELLDATRSDFVLQDHMFEPDASWSLPAHLFRCRSGRRKCTKRNDPQQLRERSSRHPVRSRPRTRDPWAARRPDLRVDRPHVSPAPAERLVGLLRRDGHRARLHERRCARLRPGRQSARRRPASGTRCPYFDTVNDDDQLGNIQSVTSFYTAAQAGTLPAVSWVVPSGQVSEHPPSPVSAGQSYVTSLVERGDAAAPTGTRPRSSWRGTTGAASTTTSCRPTVDENGYGLRVPGIVISPYAKTRLHRPPDPQLRRVRQVHRGRLPRRPAPRPEDRRPARPAPDRARERARSSATSPATSTSTNRRAHPCSSRSIRRPPSSADELRAVAFSSATRSDEDLRGHRARRSGQRYSS